MHNVHQAEITSDQLSTLITATGNEVEAYWPTLFSSFIAKAGIEELILSASSGGGGGGGGGGGDGGDSGDAAPAEEEKKEEEEEEEIDMGGGMDMFGGGKCPILVVWLLGRSHHVRCK